jgi:phage gp46-like protein
MPGLDRKLDPLTGDYLSDTVGGYVETESIQPALYHQLKTERGRWWGDADAGCDLYLVRASNLDQTAVVFAKDAIRTALQPFVEAGQARDLVVEAVGGALGRLTVAISLVDTATGEALHDVAPIGEE